MPLAAQVLLGLQLLFKDSFDRDFECELSMGLRVRHT